MKRATMIVAVALVLGALSGCASEREREFGSSVRHMVAGQRDNPASPEATVGNLDGAKAAKAVDNYRGDKKPGGAKPATSTILVPTASSQ